MRRTIVSVFTQQTLISLYWKNAKNAGNKCAVCKHEETCLHSTLNSLCARAENQQILVYDEIQQLFLFSFQFWSAYVPCETQYKNAVTLTLEQIDVIKRFVKIYGDELEFVTSAEGKIWIFCMKLTYSYFTQNFPILYSIQNPQIILKSFLKLL